jgi:ADP-ribosylglycohydrolase
MALTGAYKEDIYIEATENVTDPALIEALTQASDPRQIRDVTHSRGWVAHAFYCAYWALLHFDDYQSAVDQVITHSKKGNTVGDTDTNTAIAGALLGAYYGITQMKADDRTSRSVDIMLSADTSLGDVPRPSKYEMSSATLAELMKAYKEYKAYGV